MPNDVRDLPASNDGLSRFLGGSPLALGLLGAVGMALFVEYLDSTVRSAEDLELKTGVPVLGVIPPARSRGTSIDATATSAAPTASATT